VTSVATSTSSRPLVSVIIVNFNGRAHLAECLDAVLAQSYPHLEVVLVDNGSVDGSADFVARAYPTVTVVRSEVNLGFAGGNNLAGRHCAGDYVFFLNNDTRADPEAIAALVRARDAYPDYAVFGSLLLDHADPSKVDSAGDTFYWMGWTFAYTGYAAAQFDRPRPIASAKGAAVLYPRALLDRLGWFDADFFLSFEDVDLSLRARHAGARILFVPESRVHHKGFASFAGRRSPLNVYYASRNYQLAVLKTFPLPVLLRFLPGFAFAKTTQVYGALRDGCLGACLRGNLASLRLVPRILVARRRILKGSRLSAREFGSLFRKKMLSEWLMSRRRKLDVADAAR
jgi:GT2 family glycosyltransferase